ncbi:MAG: DUF4390 domain-containing protein [Magnetococcales bacterium]|nr:DUF4390 domain-containing protein [Magnetococcales bacterium]
MAWGGIALQSSRRRRILLGSLLALYLGGCSAPEETRETCEVGHLFTCQETKSLTQPGVIQQAAVFPQGDKLYAKVELDQNFLKQLTEFLNDGEPLWATYRFRLYRTHPWWPDLRISKVTLKRRLRLRLITRRFEMLDGQTGQIQYTSSPEEAMSFLGAPRYVLLGILGDEGKSLSADRAYRLNVDLTLEHEDLSSLFHLLDQWFRFGQSGTFRFQVAYTP